MTALGPSEPAKVSTSRASYLAESENVSSLIESLEDNTKLRKAGRCTKFSNNVHGLEITSWRFNEWDYNKVPLPINARGLFTLGDKIVARGYDKFFNFNETETTSLSSLAKKSSLPYTVTLKENGCIIFISGLQDGSLLVCSKHSTGERSDLTRNHAVKGELALVQQLAEIGRSSAELAKYLYESNATAVAEYCDDEFEEHVLGYNKEKSGLYLHGINLNTIKFSTYSMDRVSKIALEWGFKEIRYFLQSDFKSLLSFLEESAKTGTYEGREVEGFVIRTTVDGHDFFFKYKFKEPYLLYRQLREVTRDLIIEGESSIPRIVAGVKLHRYITFKYLNFASEIFERRPELKNQFLDGHGIIKMRQQFLERIDQSLGIQLMQFDKLDSALKLASIVKYKYVLVSIATIGCGKTTVFETLTNLFGWPHIQNDNLSNGASKNKLAVLTLEALQTNEVVLVDRNNHQFRERKQLLDSVLKLRKNFLPPDVGIRFIALDFIPEDIEKSKLWDITFNRIKQRGDNHQSIRVVEDEGLAMSVMIGFMNRYQAVDSSKSPDSQFYRVIHLQLGNDSSLDNSKIVCLSMRKDFPDLDLIEPSPQDFENAFQKALQYKPTFTKEFGKKKAKKIKRVNYIAIEVSGEFLSKVNQIASSNETWLQLTLKDRVKEDFHVTVGHSFHSKLETEGKTIIDDMKSKLKIEDSNEKEEKVYTPYFADVKLNDLVIEQERLACVEIEILRVYDSDANNVTIVPTNKHLHITLGTMDPLIKPVETNAVLNELHAHGNSEKIESFPIDNAVLERQRIYAQY